MNGMVELVGDGSCRHAGLVQDRRAGLADQPSTVSTPRPFHDATLWQR
jgi:hypothetical protein